MYLMQLELYISLRSDPNLGLHQVFSIKGKLCLVSFYGSRYEVPNKGRNVVTKCSKCINYAVN